MHHDQAKSLGQLLRHRRQEMSLTQRQLATLTHMRDSTIVRLERGFFVSPSPAKLKHLATALGLPIADLFALAGYVVPDELPSFEVYLRAKYPGLSVAARTQLSRNFQEFLRISETIAGSNEKP